MLAVGVDLIELVRVKDGLETYGQRFLDRVFTEGEQLYCNGRVECLAARFAAKEAVSKALGTGIGDASWQDIEIINEENGRPVLFLHGAAREIARKLNLDTWSISLSHTETHAIGMVVAMCGTGDK
jgi:holo-[acyl-carrier protein] synthase